MFYIHFTWYTNLFKDGLYLLITRALFSIIVSLPKVDIFDGGVPTTFEHSGEQWDYPNAWPPLQYIVITGLANTGHPEAMRYATEIATKWVRSNFEVWRQKTAMLEKVGTEKIF